jgi:hypothetical protein
MRVVLAALVLGLVLVPAAGAKEGLSARLLQPLPTDPQPSSTIEVSWQLTALDGTKRVPFNAMGVFVRLLDAAGGPSTSALARGASHPDGRYDASVSVPAGGIGGIQIGLHGTTDIFAPVEDSPFVQSALLSRPLTIPRLRPAARCPVSKVHRTAFGPGLGPGPVYARFGTGSTLKVRDRRQKVLWFSLASYTGPIVIRGGRIDGTGTLGFDASRDASWIFIAAGSGIRNRPSSTWADAPGCYAYQVDGTGFSRTIVFRVARA